MSNELLKNIEYKIEETPLGRWRRYGYQNGTSFHEFKSHRTWMNLPLIHYIFGRCPETGRRKLAKGVIAIGRLSYGVVAIGQASFGLIAIGQLAIGIVFGLGQLATGLAAVGQAAIAIWFALGQVAIGNIAIGQIAIGKYVLAQIGVGEFVWSIKRADPQAIKFFKSLPLLRHILPPA